MFILLFQEETPVERQDTSSGQ